MQQKKPSTKPNRLTCVDNASEDRDLATSGNGGRCGASSERAFRQSQSDSNLRRKSGVGDGGDGSNLDCDVAYEAMQSVCVYVCVQGCSSPNTQHATRKVARNFSRVDVTAVRSFGSLVVNSRAETPSENGSFGKNRLGGGKCEQPGEREEEEKKKVARCDQYRKNAVADVM